MAWRFAEFVFDPDRVQVLRGASPVHLEPKAFQLLGLLLSRRPRAVSKEEIHEAIWPGTTVSESSLPGLVRDLRAALADDCDSPRLIRTVRGHGYAFCAAVDGERGEGVEPCRWLVLQGGREIPLPAGTHVVGRGESCSIRFASSRVSRRHAVVHVDERAATIEDLGSRNGTFLRGQRVERASEIQPGDVVGIGPEELRFVTTDSLESTTD